VQPTVLRVAAGPKGSAYTKLIADLASELARDNGKNVKLRFVKTAGAAESAAELDAGRADLAVVRSDVAMSTTGLTVAILHRNAVILIAPRSSKVRSIVDLNKKDVGIVNASPENERLLEQLLVEYGVSSQATTLVPLDPDEVAEAVRTKSVDAVMVLAPASGKLAKEVVDSVAAGSGREPVLVGIKEAEAIARRKPVYKAEVIINGLFGGDPPRPSESYKTIAVTYTLVASRNIDDSIISELPAACSPCAWREPMTLRPQSTLKSRIPRRPSRCRSIRALPLTSTIWKSRSSIATMTGSTRGDGVGRSRFRYCHTDRLHTRTGQAVGDRRIDPTAAHRTWRDANGLTRRSRGQSGQHFNHHAAPCQGWPN
jgi:TRAP-type uncharacterized transport system substrate-binding protein